MAFEQCDAFRYDTPPPARILYSIEIPKIGGATQFVCQESARAGLSPVLREQVSGLSIKHDATHTSIGKLRQGYEVIDDVREIPGAIRPVVKRHEETGCNNLSLPA